MDTLTGIKSTLRYIKDKNARKIIDRILDVLIELGADDMIEYHRKQEEEELKDQIDKQAVEETLDEIKDKVEDLMDDGKLNQSNKKTSKKKVKK